MNVDKGTSQDVLFNPKEYSVQKSVQWEPHKAPGLDTPEQEFTSGDAGRMTEAGISMRIVASGTRAPLHDDQRSLSITTWHYNKTVRINASESPSSGGAAKGAYPLEKVDRQLVEDELVGFVARMVAA